MEGGRQVERERWWREREGQKREREREERKRERRERERGGWSNCYYRNTNHSSVSKNMSLL